MRLSLAVSSMRVWMFNWSPKTLMPTTSSLDDNHDIDDDDDENDYDHEHATNITVAIITAIANTARTTVAANIFVVVMRD